MSSIRQYGVQEPGVLGGKSLAELLDEPEGPAHGKANGDAFVSLLRKPNQVDPSQRFEVAPEDEVSQVESPAAPITGAPLLSFPRQGVGTVGQYDEDTVSEASTTATKQEIKAALRRIQPQPTEPPSLHRRRKSLQTNLRVAPTTTTVAEIVLQDTEELKMAAPLPPPPVCEREFLTQSAHEVTSKVGTRGPRFLSRGSTMPVQQSFIPPPEYSVPLGAAKPLQVTLRPGTHRRTSVQEVLRELPASGSDREMSTRSTEPPYPGFTRSSPLRRHNTSLSPAAGVSPYRERERDWHSTPFAGRALYAPEGSDISREPLTPLSSTSLPYGTGAVVNTPQPPSMQKHRDAPNFHVPTENERLLENVWENYRKSEPTPTKVRVPHIPLRVCSDIVDEEVIVIEDNGIVNSPVHYDKSPEMPERPKSKTSSKGPPRKLPNNVSVSPVLRTPIPMQTPPMHTPHEEIVLEVQGDIPSPSPASPPDLSPESEGAMVLASTSPTRSPCKFLLPHERPDFVSPSIGRAASAAPPPSNPAATPPLTQEGSVARSSVPSVHIPFGNHPNVTVPNADGDDLTFTLTDGALYVSSEVSPPQMVTRAIWDEKNSKVDLAGTGHEVVARGDALQRLRPLLEAACVEHNVPLVKKRRVSIMEPHEIMTPEGARPAPDDVVECSEVVSQQPALGTAKQPSKPGTQEKEGDVTRQPDYVPGEEARQEEKKVEGGNDSRTAKDDKCCCCLVM